MPKNMTETEAREAAALLHALFPSPGAAPDVAAAFEPASFNLSAEKEGPFVLLRLADRSGALLDIRLSQIVAAELAGHLAKSLCAIGWIDSRGGLLTDPDPPSR